MIHLKNKRKVRRGCNVFGKLFKSKAAKNIFHAIFIHMKLLIYSTDLNERNRFISRHMVNIYCRVMALLFPSRFYN